MKRHGLTLIELLASLVILSMLAGATVPMLRSLASDGQEGLSVDRGLITEFVDQWLTEMTQGLIPIEAGQSWTIDPTDTGSPTIRISAHEAQPVGDTGDSAAVWLVFDAGQLYFVRHHQWELSPPEDDAP